MQIAKISIMWVISVILVLLGRYFIFRSNLKILLSFISAFLTAPSILLCYFYIRGWNIADFNFVSQSFITGKLSDGFNGNGFPDLFMTFVTNGFTVILLLVTLSWVFYIPTDNKRLLEQEISPYKEMFNTYLDDYLKEHPTAPTGLSSNQALLLIKDSFVEKLDINERKKRKICKRIERLYFETD